MDHFYLDDETIDKIETEIAEIVFRAIRKYEEMGLHLSDVAADIVLVPIFWLLELQLNHAIYGNTNSVPWDSSGI